MASFRPVSRSASAGDWCVSACIRDNRRIKANGVCLRRQEARSSCSPFDGRALLGQARRAGASMSRRNGNHVGLPGLHGGRCRDRTDGHRGFAPSGRGICPENLNGGDGQAGGANYEALLPISLRFHSLSFRKRAMVVTCSQTPRRRRVPRRRDDRRTPRPRPARFRVRGSRW